jgi:hypothetical protein
MGTAANVSQIDEGLKTELQKSGIFVTTLEGLYNWGVVLPFGRFSSDLPAVRLK